MKRKKRKLNYKKITKLVIILVIFYYLCHFSFNLITLFYNPKQKVNKPNPSNEISLILAGDVMIHTGSSKEALPKVRPFFTEEEYVDNYFKKDDTFDFSPQFELVKPIISQYDLAFVNQESILGGVEIGLTSFFVSNAPYEAGDAIVDLGFNLISLANNHTFDRGLKAIENSVNYWKTKDVLTSGSYLSLEDQRTPIIKEKNGIKYTMLAYTTFTNFKSFIGKKDYHVNYYNEQKVKEDIQKVRDKVDLLIVSIHDGYEYVYNESQDQRDIANYLADLGVDIVVGHHPHVVQPVEFIGNTLVFYSLGNFFSIQDYAERRMSMLASLNIKKDIVEGKTKLTFKDLEGEFTYTYFDGNWEHIKLIPFRNINENYLSNYKNHYQKLKDVATKYTDKIRIKPLN